MQPLNTKSIYIAIIITVLIIFIVIIGLLYNNQSKQKNKESAQTEKPLEKTMIIPTKVVSIGNLTLITYLPSVKTNENLILSIVGDSAGQTVSGYDVLVSYDKDAFDFIEGKSKDDDFSIFTFKRDSHITITAVKALQNITETKFSQTPILTLTFQPKKAGNYSFSIEPQIGKETTTMVTDKTEKLNPEGSTISVNVN